MSNASSSRKPSDIRIRDVRTSLECHPFRTPLKFGGEQVNDCVLLNTLVTVERGDGRQARGFGSMPLGNVWAFPPRYVPPSQSLEAMRGFADELAAMIRTCDLYGHPLDLARELEPEAQRLAATLSRAMKLPVSIPKLCTLVVFSPFDAAIFDAFGWVNGVNSFNALGRDFVRDDLACDLDERFRGQYLDACTLRQPKATMPLYHLVGALDPLTDGDVAQRIGDGLPETLPEWIERDGLTHLKIKLNGSDLQWDIDRVLAVESVSAETQIKRGVKTWHYSLDFNERCPNVEYLLALFARVKESSPAGFERIQYVEQPTDRDLRAHPDNRMHQAAAIKPVVIDESLTDYASLLLAREQGYTGVALKACKGMTHSLLMAAAARAFNMFVAVQDLTCPGASFLQSAELAARIPGVAAVEGNGRQYCPDASHGWAERYPEVFTVRDGLIRTGGLTGVGLGHRAEEHTTT